MNQTCDFVDFVNCSRSEREKKRLISLIDFNILLELSNSVAIRFVHPTQPLAVLSTRDGFE